MQDIFHLNREFPHFPWFKCNEIMTHYQGGHTLQNIKKMSYWRNCDSCYDENSFKKKIIKYHFFIFLFFFKVCFICNITLCQCKKYDSWLIIIMKYYYEYKIPSKAK